jgi:hypothetical protein
MARNWRDRWKDFRDAATEAYGEGRQDHTKAVYAAREMAGQDIDQPRIVETVSTNPTFTRSAELLGKKNPNLKEARRRQGMGEKTTMAGKLGQMAGTLGADLTQDTTRGLYWLLNAAQATGNVINEAALARANPRLYGADYAKDRVHGIGRIPVMKEWRNNQVALDNKLLDPETGTLRRGVGIKEVKEKVGDREVTNKYYTKRNFDPGHVAALGIPSGVAINTGLGLMTPFGGAEGYWAAMPSEDDPTKTSNVLGEVALKYFMGRTGNLLPYDEFSKVRPDVSPQEYGQYQAWKYRKGEDWNPLDGDFSIAAGALRGTDEGIHGPEVQFLGRSLPATTGIVPFAAAVAGGAMGVRTETGGRFGRFGGPVRGGFLGATAGLVAGQVAGNLLENERRRRNTVINQLENPQY